MGGIMASSPELLGEVQKFKTGTRNGEVVEANSMLSRILNPYLTPKQRNNFIGRAIAGEYGLEVQKDTMNSALAGTFGENVRAKAESLKPILSGYGLGSESEDGLGSIDITEAFDNLEVDQAPELLQGVTPPFVQETSPVLSQPSVQPNTFSSESMINEQAPRSTGPEFSPLARLAPRLFGDVVPSGMPLVEGPGPAPAFPMNTAADSTDPLGVLTNPRTDEPMTLLPPQERSPQALEPRSGIRTLLDRVLTRGKAPDRDPRVARETPGFMDSDAGSVMGFSPEINPEMSDKLKRLEKLRTAQSGQNVLISAADIAGGALGSAGAEILGTRDNLRGYVAGVAGFPTMADRMFQQAQASQNNAESYFGEGNVPLVSNYFSEGTAAEELAAQRAQIQAESEAAIENADASVFSEGAPTELTPAARAARARSDAELTAAGQRLVEGQPIEAKGLSPEAIEQIQSQITTDRELDAAGQRLVAGQPIEAGPVDMEKINAQNAAEELFQERLNAAGQGLTNTNVPVKTEEFGSGDLTPEKINEINAQILAEKENTIVEADTIGSLNLTPEKINEINAQILAEKENTIIAEEVTSADIDAAMAIAEEEGSNSTQLEPAATIDTAAVIEDLKKGGTGSDAIIGGITGTNQNFTPKESVKAYQAIFKEMMGIDDEDKEKEKYHQMAMIGFAVAAGKSDNALENVAVGLLEGTKLARKDRKDKKTLMSKVNMAAFDAARQDTRDAAKYTQQLDLADATRKNRLDDNFLKDFRVQKNAHLKSMGDTKVLGKVSDPQQMSRDAARLAFQDMYQMYGKDSLLSSSLYATNKEDIDMAIGAIDAAKYG